MEVARLRAGRLSKTETGFGATEVDALIVGECIDLAWRIGAAGDGVNDCFGRDGRARCHSGSWSGSARCRWVIDWLRLARFWEEAARFELS